MGSSNGTGFLTSGPRVLTRWGRRLWAAVFFCVLWPGLVAASCAADTVFLRGDWGQARFSVELADTGQTRSRGLMFRESLPMSSGMLFIYDRPQRVSFWMKNTLIPLDMIFVDPQGQVTRVHHDAVPGDLTSIPGGDGILAVLEINGGLARSLGIAEGSLMRHPVFADGPALWPC